MTKNEENKKFVKQKLVITIESTAKGTVNIKQKFTPALDMKNEENNNRAILECWAIFMEMLKERAKEV